MPVHTSSRRPSLPALSRWPRSANGPLTHHDESWPGSGSSPSPSLRPGGAPTGLIRAPHSTTIRLVLAAVDGDAPGRAIGRFLQERRSPATGRSVIAVDGKSNGNRRPRTAGFAAPGPPARPPGPPGRALETGPGLRRADDRTDPPGHQPAALRRTGRNHQHPHRPRTDLTNSDTRSLHAKPLLARRPEQQHKIVL